MLDGLCWGGVLEASSCRPWLRSAMQLVYHKAMLSVSWTEFIGQHRPIVCAWCRDGSGPLRCLICWSCCTRGDEYEAAARLHPPRQLCIMSWPCVAVSRWHLSR